jgi:hypothetical protein
VLSVGFVRIGEWRSCYWHPRLRLFLVVYVDDFKMSGPASAMEEGWTLIRSGLDIDAPHVVGTFQGCVHRFADCASPWSGKVVRTVDYDMESFLVTCVDKYREMSGCKDLCPAVTHFLEDVDPLDGVAHSTVAPDSGVVGLCPEGKPGELANVAARVLMKLLYAAHVCRYELLQAIGRLAGFVTRWDAHCDKMLHRVMCYVQSSLSLRCVGWVGDSVADVGLHLYADADFVGCKRTGRSTSGVFFCVAGADTFFPISGMS